jgi:hypothetical protein
LISARIAFWASVHFVTHRIVTDAIGLATADLAAYTARLADASAERAEPTAA